MSSCIEYQKTGKESEKNKFSKLKKIGGINFYEFIGRKFKKKRVK